MIRFSCMVCLQQLSESRQVADAKSERDDVLRKIQWHDPPVRRIPGSGPGSDVGRKCVGQTGDAQCPISEDNKEKIGAKLVFLRTEIQLWKYQWSRQKNDLKNADIYKAGGVRSQGYGWHGAKHKQGIRYLHNLLPISLHVRYCLSQCATCFPANPLGLERVLLSSAFITLPSAESSAFEIPVCFP